MDAISECYVSGEISKYDINNFNKTEMYFPKSKGDAVIVFYDAKVYWWSIFTFEYYLMIHIMLLVICLLPIECWHHYFGKFQCGYRVSQLCYCPPGISR